MFYDHLIKLLKELNIEGLGSIARDSPFISLQLEGIPITITDSPPGIEISAVIGKAPLENQEAIYTKLLRGNLLGQATRKACLGLDEAGENIVLSASIPSIRSYREFKDSIEDFVNAVMFWKEESQLPTTQREQKG